MSCALRGGGPGGGVLFDRLVARTASGDRGVRGEDARSDAPRQSEPFQYYPTTQLRGSTRSIGERDRHLADAAAVEDRPVERLHLERVAVALDAIQGEPHERLRPPA